MLRAARFDRTLYEELRQDPVAVAQAFFIMAVAVAAMVAGALMFVALSGQSAWILALALIDSLALWLLPALSLFLLGGLARVNDPERGSDRDLLIAIGFSASPGMLWLVPHPLFAVVVWGWVMSGMMIAARTLLQVSLFRSAVYVLPGVLMYWLLSSIFTALVNRG